jgi:hypothetical protein
LREAWPDVGPLVRHFHISEPNLGDFTAPEAPHADNLRVLREGGYAGWCSVEMLEPSQDLAVVGPWAFVPDGHDAGG